MNITIHITQAAIIVGIVLLYVFLATILTAKQINALDIEDDLSKEAVMGLIILCTMPVYLVVVIIRQVFIKKWK